MPTLDWIGKAAVVDHHRQVPYRLLHCDRKLSAGDPDSGNLLVQGDNLLALKALLPYYAGKVKCIYIDPPYNTGGRLLDHGPLQHERFAKGRNGMIPTMKSRQRIIDHGEVFTPPGLVNDMLDLVAHECERIDSRFLEPACGNGNFLAEVLRRKLLTVDKRNTRNREKWERDAILSVCSLYGIDLLPDNIADCRCRLLDVVRDAHAACFKSLLPDEAARAAAYILSKNIVQGDALTFLNSDDRPIVFPEWSPVNGSMLKRRDFAYDHLLEQAHIASTPLFSDLGKDVYLPTPVAELPPCHYLSVPHAEASHERS